MITYIGIREIENSVAIVAECNVKSGHLGFDILLSTALSFDLLVGQVHTVSTLARLDLAESRTTLVSAFTVLGLLGVVLKQLTVASLVPEEAKVALEILLCALAVGLLHIRHAVVVVDTARSVRLATPVHNLKNNHN